MPITVETATTPYLSGYGIGYENEITQSVGLPDLGTVWTDRRPIGQIILTGGGTTVGLNVWNQGTPDPASNPSGFQTFMVNTFNTAIANTQSCSGQGIIVWDITGWGLTAGSQHGQSYLGDPRFLRPRESGLTQKNNYAPYVPPHSALGQGGVEPAMDAIADTLFANIIKGGLIPGVCVRAEQVWVDVNGDLQRSALVQNGEDQRWYDNILMQLADLDAKISYAYNRWGCRIFYIDSNTASVEMISPLQTQSNPTYAPAWLYHQLRMRHPDCLLIPEEYFTGAFHYSDSNVSFSDLSYSYVRDTCHYSELVPNIGSPGSSATEALVVPSAFNFVSLKNMPGTTYLDGQGALTNAQITTALQKNQMILMPLVWYNTDNSVPACKTLLHNAGLFGQ